MSKVDVRDEMDSDKSEVEGGEGRGQKIAFLCVYSSQLSLFPNAAASTEASAFSMARGGTKSGPARADKAISGKLTNASTNESGRKAGGD